MVRYKKGDEEFLRTLKKRVREYFTDRGLSQKANSAFYIKGIVLILCYALAYVLAQINGENTTVFLSLYALMGPLAFLIIINIGHDAVHGAISDRPVINKACLLVFDLLGPNSFMWGNRHLGSHHKYQNVAHLDSDIPVVPVLRIFPHFPATVLHRYQYLYMPLVYLVYTAHWIIRRDFADFLSKNIGSYKTNFRWNDLVLLFIFKVLYFFYIVGAPILFFSVPLWTAIGGFFVLGAAASICVSLILVSSHVGDQLEFPLPDENDQLPYTWPEHQLKTTSDFAVDDPVLNFLFGGFNHHTFHHFFPGTNHVHYPNLTPILKQTALEFGLPYNCEKGLLSSIKMHWKLLYNRGRKGPQTA